MLELPIELRTPMFERVYQRFRDQPRIAFVSRIPWPIFRAFHDEIVPAGYPVVCRIQTPDTTRQPCDVFDWLRATHGDRTLRVRIADYASPRNYVASREYEEVSLAEYLDYMANCSDHLPRYAGNQALPAVLATDLAIQPPAWYSTDAYEPPAFWLGAARSVTPLHKDSTDNFAYQVVGSKRWTLFPVRDAPHLAMSRPDQNEGMDFATSAIDMRQSDIDQFPGLQHVVPISLILEAGEMLYLPAGWAHFVETVTPSITINYWLSRAFFRSLWKVAA